MYTYNFRNVAKSTRSNCCNCYHSYLYPLVVEWYFQGNLVNQTLGGKLASFLPERALSTSENNGHIYFYINWINNVNGWNKRILLGMDSKSWIIKYEQLFCNTIFFHRGRIAIHLWSSSWLLVAIEEIWTIH